MSAGSNDAPVRVDYMDSSISNQARRKDSDAQALVAHFLVPLVFFGPFAKLNQKDFRHPFNHRM